MGMRLVHDQGCPNNPNAQAVMAAALALECTNPQEEDHSCSMRRHDVHAVKVLHHLADLGWGLRRA